MTKKESKETRNIGIFMDGRRFYRELRRHDPTLAVDFRELRSWLERRMAKVLSLGEVRSPEMRYYTSVPKDGSATHQSFLDGLSGIGYYIRSVQMHESRLRCTCCTTDNRHTFETEPRELCAQMISEMIEKYNSEEIDMVVLVCPGSEIVPGMAALRAMDCPVAVASWGYDDRFRIRKLAAATINLNDGVADSDEDGTGFGFDRLSDESAHWQLMEKLKDRVVDEILAAQEHFEPHGYVGRGLMATKWRGRGLPRSADLRDDLINDLVADNRVEEYPVSTDGGEIKALRVVGHAR